MIVVGCIELKHTVKYDRKEKESKQRQMNLITFEWEEKGTKERLKRRGNEKKGKTGGGRKGMLRKIEV